MRTLGLLAVATILLTGSSVLAAEVIQGQPDGLLVQKQMNQRASKITIEVLNDYLEPVYLEGVESLKGQITFSDGSRQNVEFRADDWSSTSDGSEIDYLSNTFSYRAPWITGDHEVDITVQVPLEGGFHELSFPCVASSVVASLSGM